MLLVVSGPSGAGKDTLIERLRQREPKLAYGVSVTTRPPRPYEREGIHYHFTNRDEFERGISAGQFLETREYAGSLYGTPRRFVEDALQHGHDLILKPEVNGARAIKSLYKEAVLVFLTAPSEQELQRRLEERHMDSSSDINERLHIAHEEEEAMSQFDYRIINDEVETALTQLHAILTAERLKVARLLSRSSQEQQHS
ncbi:MAG: guanylate kinase [Candidatus Eremiobacteraeota bacterium]|nr:guanylate kinase [Candidatus Eremiobacteraeota bacterium]